MPDCPPEILKAILAAEASRMECPELPDLNVCAAYFPDYCTDSPGYHGPLVVIVWPGDPGAVSTFIQRAGQWQHCNSSTW